MVRIGGPGRGRRSARAGRQVRAARKKIAAIGKIATEAEARSEINRARQPSAEEWGRRALVELGKSRPNPEPIRNAEALLPGIIFNLRRIDARQMQLDKSGPLMPALRRLRAEDRRSNEQRINALQEMLNEIRKKKGEPGLE